jgi:hypothetical protein
VSLATRIVIPIQPRTMPAGCSGDNRQTIIKVSRRYGSVSDRSCPRRWPAETGLRLPGCLRPGKHHRGVAPIQEVPVGKVAVQCAGGVDGQDWAGSVEVFAVPGPDVAGQPFGEFRAAWAVP